MLFPYDWRLSNRYNGSALAEAIRPRRSAGGAGRGGPYADAKVVLVVHSMGGLVARWYIERCDGAEVTRKLITLGTPYRGAGKALEQLVNGVRVGPGTADPRPRGALGLLCCRRCTSCCRTTRASKTTSWS